MRDLDALRSLMSSQMVVAIFLVALLVSLHTRLRQQEFHKWWIAGWTMFALFLALGRLALAFPAEWTIAKGTVVFLTTLVGFLMVPPLIFGGQLQTTRIDHGVGRSAIVAAAAVAIAAFVASLSHPIRPAAQFLAASCPTPCS